MSAKQKVASSPKGELEGYLNLYQFQTELQNILGTKRCVIEVGDFIQGQKVGALGLMMITQESGIASLLPRPEKERSRIFVRMTSESAQKFLGLSLTHCNKPGYARLHIRKGRKTHTFIIRTVRGTKHYYFKGSKGPWSLAARLVH